MVASQWRSVAAKAAVDTWSTNKERYEMPGLLAGLLSKLAGLGTLAKGGIAAATAALTMTVAGGATGVLPLPGGHADAGAVVQSVVHPTSVVPASTAASVSTGTAGGSGVQAAAGTSPSPSSGSTSTHASVGGSTPAAGGGTATGAGAKTAPSVVGGVVPTLPALPPMPACVKDLIPAKGTTPDPATFISKLTTCIQSLLAAHLPAGGIEGVLGSSNLPAGVSKCLSSVFASIPGLSGGTSSTVTPSSMSQVLAACVPAGAMPGLGTGSIPGMGSVPVLGSTPTRTPGR